ncbi:MAG: ECF-type sigma factor [Wenzhouxiangellaceae bacterium]|nr:ECF-type sigma factor [Wenzhouxiangellaceae bacterium]
MSTRDPASADHGETQARLERVYQSLRGIARRERARNPSQTLNTTVLVHEAWLKLEQSRTDLASDNHLMATFALAARQILVDYARRRAAVKRTHSEDYEAFELGDRQTRTIEDILAMEQALEQLEALDDRLARLVELRFFVGCTLEEAADCLDISHRTATRDWTRARAFLKTVLT